MQWPVLRRAFPWRIGLLMGSVPALALAASLAWFRWELPTIQRYYLVTYWESSRHAETPASTTQVEWLYKAAPARNDEIVIAQDVEPNGAGLFPIGLSSFARERGWTELVKAPTERWKSSELESFLQEGFYDNRTFRQLIAEPLAFMYVIPFLVLYVGVTSRQELVLEWKRLHELCNEVEFEGELRAIWWKFQLQFRAWKQRVLGGTRASFPKPRIEPKEQPAVTANRGPFNPGDVTPLNRQNPVASTVSPAKPKRHMIFPGTGAISTGEVRPKPWDESQWID